MAKVDSHQGSLGFDSYVALLLKSCMLYLIMKVYIAILIKNLHDSRFRCASKPYTKLYFIKFILR